MVRPYLSKIRVNTAKNIAKNLLTTKAGKSISDTKLKQFLKQDKDLKKFAYKPKNAQITKLQSKQFFQKVVGSAKESNNLKVSRLAQKKMGIRLDKKGEFTKTGLNRMYQHAASEQIATDTPTGPTPKELQEQKKRETRIKTMHQHDLAREAQKEKEQQNNQNQDQPEKKVTSPIARQAVGSSNIAQAGQPTSQGATLDDKTSSPASAPADNSQQLFPLLILPLFNLSVNITSLVPTKTKIDQAIRQTLQGMQIFKIIPQADIDQALQELNYQNIPSHTDQEAIITLAKQVGAIALVAGHIQKKGNITEVTVNMINTKNGQPTPLAKVKEDTDDTFNLEKKVKWQITNAIKGSADSQDAAPPSANEAVDLPI